MGIKAIIFDLDDTLYDCSGTLSCSAQERAIHALLKAGLATDQATAQKAVVTIRKSQKARINIVEALVEKFGPKRDTLIEVGLAAYNLPDEIEEITLFPGVQDMLLTLRPHYKLILVTSGFSKRQRNKIKTLGLEQAFDLILIDDISDRLSKRERFQAAMINYGLVPSDVLVVGDRVFSEIKIGNQLGMTTVQVLHGHYAHLVASKESEEPDYTIPDTKELLPLLNQVEKRMQPKIAMLGGGTGLPALLSGLRKYNCDLSAIVSVTDSGRSSGKLRKAFGVAPPGDIRNCLAALAAGDQRLAELLQYRFTESELEGHTLGNLLLVALTKMRGSFGAAVQELAEQLGSCGEVFPASLDNLHIEAELEDGRWLRSEDEIVNPVEGEEPLHLRSKIKQVRLNKEASAYLPAVEAIMQADLVTLGPGGLYTSVISSLLIPAIAEAIKNTNAKILYICNVVTQPGQTDGFDSVDHLKKIHEAIPGRKVDYICVHSRSISEKLEEVMAEVHSASVKADCKEIEKMGVTVIAGNFVEKVSELPELWKKTHLLKHDASRLAEAIISAATVTLTESLA